MVEAEVKEEEVAIIDELEDVSVLFINFISIRFSSFELILLLLLIK